MYLRNFISTFILPLTVSAARHRHQHRSFGPPTTTTVTVTDTVTENIAPSLSTVTSGNSTSTAPSNVPTGPYTAVAIRSGSPFHLLAITAAGLNFTLGGAPATYCPSTIEQCPSGNSTAFLGYGAMVCQSSLPSMAVTDINSMSKLLVGSSSMSQTTAALDTRKHIQRHILREPSWRLSRTPKPRMLHTDI